MKAEKIKAAKEAAREFIALCVQAEKEIDEHKKFAYGLRIFGTMKHQSLVLQHHLVNLRKP